MTTRIQPRLPPHRLINLYTAEQIHQRINWLVDEIGRGQASENFVMVGVLRGSFMFLADLVRGLHTHALHPRMDFMTLESYHGGTESSGNVRILKDCSVDLNGADVLLVDDILDTGRTLHFAMQHLRNKGAASVRACVLLDKPSRRVVSEAQAEYIGFEIEDHFVVGYGLDFDSYYRELPHIDRVEFDPV